MVFYQTVSGETVEQTNATDKISLGLQMRLQWRQQTGGPVFFIRSCISDISKSIYCYKKNELVISEIVLVI